ncbi:MAG: hypothetical protein J0I48_19165 [Devosia sp.]|uniref:hypothetical protein n=1 Tax=Devosia sp. 66-22 TaxID=1895753 RepID=UPI00092C1399|nr:hypothetical protein [Devosia sp. 66-22]MBN9348287.1 hypothetical protein [Devosia sp.]OJX48972.1 MAG: hypothetical protein BGO81_10280 [Devosia sp. 66-22]
MSRDEVVEAIEIALGDTINGDVSNRRYVPERNVARQLTVTRRVLAELPPEVTVHELLEALEE